MNKKAFVLFLLVFFLFFLGNALAETSTNNYKQNPYTVYIESISDTALPINLHNGSNLPFEQLQKAYLPFILTNKHGVVELKFRYYCFTYTLTAVLLDKIDFKEGCTTDGCFAFLLFIRNICSDDKVVRFGQVRVKDLGLERKVHHITFKHSNAKEDEILTFSVNTDMPSYIDKKTVGLWGITFAEDEKVRAMNYWLKNQKSIPSLKQAASTTTESKQVIDISNLKLSKGYYSTDKHFIFNKDSTNMKDRALFIVNKSKLLYWVFLSSRNKLLVYKAKNYPKININNINNYDEMLQLQDKTILLKKDEQQISLPAYSYGASSYDNKNLLIRLIDSWSVPDGKVIEFIAVNQDIMGVHPTPIPFSFIFGNNKPSETSSKVSSETSSETIKVYVRQYSKNDSSKLMVLDDAVNYVLNGKSIRNIPKQWNNLKPSYKLILPFKNTVVDAAENTGFNDALNKIDSDNKPEELVPAIMLVESNFNARAKAGASNNASYGLMQVSSGSVNSNTINQINNSIAKSNLNKTYLRYADLFDPTINIYAGIIIFKEKINAMFGSLYSEGETYKGCKSSDFTKKVKGLEDLGVTLGEVLAIGAYNSGQGNVWCEYNYDGVIVRKTHLKKYPDTGNYIQNVLAAKSLFVNKTI